MHRSISLTLDIFQILSSHNEHLHGCTHICTYTVCVLETASIRKVFCAMVRIGLQLELTAPCYGLLLQVCMCVYSVTLIICPFFLITLWYNYYMYIHTHFKLQ